MTRSLLVFWLILYSLRYRTRPWNFFQLNRRYFNRTKNIFSKLELNDQIPLQWRLNQVVDDGIITPEFPVFIKPEWGQNSRGIKITRNLGELQKNRLERRGQSVTYLLQEAAVEQREFEFFYIRSTDDPQSCAIISLTETVNSSGASLVVNSISNSQSSYVDLGDQLTEQQLHGLWKMVGSIGCFRIARVGLRAASLQDLCAGRFHIIEINIFLPMPLLLLDKKLSFSYRHRFIRKSMKAAARLGAQLTGGKTPRYPIFFLKLIAHYRVKE